MVKIIFERESQSTRVIVSTRNWIVESFPLPYKILFPNFFLFNGKKKKKKGNPFFWDKTWKGKREEKEILKKKETEGRRSKVEGSRESSPFPPLVLFTDSRFPLHWRKMGRKRRRSCLRIRSVLLPGIRSNLNNRSLLTKSAGVCRFSRIVATATFYECGKIQSASRTSASGPRLNCKK